MHGHAILLIVYQRRANDSHKATMAFHQADATRPDSRLRRAANDRNESSLLTHPPANRFMLMEKQKPRIWPMFARFESNAGYVCSTSICDKKDADMLSISVSFGRPHS